MRATLYDGLSARALQVEVAVDPAALSWGAGEHERVDLNLLRRGDRASGRVVLHRSDQPDWRMVLGDGRPEWLATLPDVGTLTVRARRLYIGVATACAAAGLCLWLSSNWLLDAAAPLVPQRVTAPIGDALIASLGGRRCSGAAGSAALARLTARLRPAGGFVEPVTVSVLDTAAVNALAAPGGRIVIFRGLIDKAQGPDEVAGVLAHELTHVGLRHPTKALLRQLGVGLLIQSMGGTAGQVADLAVVLGSTRRAEREADVGAVNLLRTASISTAGLSAFFVRMAAEEKSKSRDATERLIERLNDYAATHPGSTERAAIVSAAVAKQGGVTPALDAAGWVALRGICEVPRPRAATGTAPAPPAPAAG